MKHVKSVPATYEVKADEDSGGWIVEGYASVFGNIDSYGDVVHKGAFSKSIKERMPKKKIRFFYDHAQPLGVPLELSEDDRGLKVSARISKTALGHDVKTLVEDGAIGDFSFGYDLVEDKCQPNKHGGLDLKEIKLYEFSLVGIGANEEAMLTGVKSMRLQQESFAEELDSLKKSFEKAEDSHTPTSEMATAAKRALDWVEEGYGGEGLEETGKRRGRDIAERAPLSLDVVKRMNSFFARHDVDSETEGFNDGEEGFPSPGRVAFDLWGGEPGKKWAASIVDSDDSGEDSDEKAADEGISTGDFVNWGEGRNGSTGKVTQIVTDGEVSGLSGEVTITGTEDEPAARIRVYSDGEPTDTYVGHKVSSLSRAEEPKSDSALLQKAQQVIQELTDALHAKTEPSTDTRDEEEPQEVKGDKELYEKFRAELDSMKTLQKG